MVDPTTANIGLAQPTRGSDVGTWDLPVNGNSSILDLCSGGTNVIALNNSNVILASSQFQSKRLVFNSTLTGNVTITFPTSFTKSYEIQNSCTGSSAFIVTLATSAGGQVVCAPPGEMIDVVNDGSSLIFKNLGRIGEYLDYAGLSVPAWISNCSVPPYLLCNGTAFSAGTYPALSVILGGTTLPDARGRTRYMADAGTGRITTVIAAANTVGGAGGDQLAQAHTHVNTLSDPGHTHQIPAGSGAQAPGNVAAQTNVNTGSFVSQSATTGVTINNASAFSGAAQNMPPLYIGGITLIRAG